MSNHSSHLSRDDWNNLGKTAIAPFVNAGDINEAGRVQIECSFQQNFDAVIKDGRVMVVIADSETGEVLLCDPMEVPHYSGNDALSVTKAWPPSLDVDPTTTRFAAMVWESFCGRIRTDIARAVGVMIAAERYMRSFDDYAAALVTVTRSRALDTPIRAAPLYRYSFNVVFLPNAPMADLLY